MKRINVVLFVVVVTFLFCAACNQPPEATPYKMTTENGQVWNLVWSDEFNYKGKPDPERWGYELGYIRNYEEQYYTDRRKNVRVEDGHLVIQSLKEEYEGYQYTSASVITKDTASWTYGRIEVRAKLPHGVGMWPAIWTLGVNIDEVGWPMCGEIDIMENVGYEDSFIYANIHTQAYNHEAGTAKGDRIFLSKPSQDFHIYAIEWYPDRIDFYLDEALYFTFENEGTGSDAWPFDQPQYLIINAAVGGFWGGYYGIDDDIFPQTYLIDYVRVYEAQP